MGSCLRGRSDRVGGRRAVATDTGAARSQRVGAGDPGTGE